MAEEGLESMNLQTTIDCFVPVEVGKNEIATVTWKILLYGGILKREVIYAKEEKSGS